MVTRQSNIFTPPVQASPVELPEDYYLDNFCFLLKFVYEHYEDILTAEEVDFFSRLFALPEPALRLYIRLTGRKGPLFRKDKLAYSEIGDIGTAVQALCEACLLRENPRLSGEAYLALATKAEIARWFGLDARLKREQMVLRVLCQSSPGAIRRTLQFRALMPLKQDMLATFKLLFFGNLHQDLTDFVLRDLGISPVEDYVMDPAARYFDNRSTLDSMLDSDAIHRETRQVFALECPQALKAFAAAVLVSRDHEDPVVKRRYSRIQNEVARQLERGGIFSLALDLYKLAGLPPARERAARVLAQLGKGPEALEICRHIDEEPSDEAEYEFAQMFSRKLAKQYKLQVPWIDAAPKDDFPVDTIVIEPDASVRVELLALDWFRHHGWNALYVENGLMNGLFGLYFWPIIFAEVRGAFFNPFQRGPADLFTSEFRPARRQLLDQRLADMQDSSFLRRETLHYFETRYGISNHFVPWSMLTAELIGYALDRMPVSDLQAIFQRLLRDLRHNRTGFPDLVVFPPEGGYRLVEVKGPGDSLQKNQRRWFRFFMEAGIPATILNIEFT